MADRRFDKALLVAGASLFLAGLIQGGVVDLFLNPRMALSAHLTAVQSGMALMIAGAVWNAVTLPGLGQAISRWTVITGMWGLWVALTLSAATGASEVLPMAGAGHAASAPVEAIVSALVIGSSGLMTVGWALLLVGLVRYRAGR